MFIRERPKGRSGGRWDVFIHQLYVCQFDFIYLPSSPMLSCHSSWLLRLSFPYGMFGDLALTNLPT